MKEILTVTTLTERIRELLEDGFGIVWVEGEVSNLRRPASGHQYFTLKDDRSQIRGVLFRSAFAPERANRFSLEEGMGVVCRGRVSVYPPRGDYQLIVDHVEPLGLGALQKAFEQLKSRLEAEGLFDAARKRPLPFLPHRIAVITSPTGAVIRDILNVTGRRFPSVPILLVPVRVQGPEASAEIIRALQDVQTRADVDCVILARGAVPWRTSRLSMTRAWRGRLPGVACRWFPPSVTRRILPLPISWPISAPRPPRRRRNWPCRSGTNCRGRWMRSPVA